ncbi:MAG: universal stress protein [Acidobacteriaceae bacterium]
MSIRNILLATDFSRCSEVALQFAVFVAERYKAKLLMVHVISESVYKDVPPEILDEAKIRIRADAQAKLQWSRQLVKELPVEVLLEEGPVADTVLALSESRAIDLLVVGTRGHRRIERLLLGSVAEKLSRQARCPVFVVPESAFSYGSEISLNTILCPTNFSDRSKAALKHGWEMAKMFSGRMLLLHVVEGSTPSRADRIQQRMVTEQRLSRLSSLVSNGAASPEIELTVEFGSIAQSIARVAAERGASLVVLSIERNKPVVAHLPPTITYSVAQQVSCPILTIAS